MENKINPQIQEILKSYSIPYEEGLLCLLAVYYSLHNPFPSYIPMGIIAKVYACGIFSMEKNNEVIWKVNLFEEQITKFDWVKNYREIFKKINPERAGSLSTCILRMKKFFSENPDVRVEDVRGALKMYIRTVKDPQYLITSHKFIYDGAGTSRNSHLEEWVEKYKETLGNDERISPNNTMQ